jgi:hypothetical protein
MALKRTQDGIFSPPAPLKLNADGTVNVQSIVSLNLTIQSLITHLNKGLSLGDGTTGSQTGNIFGEWLAFVTPSSANVEFELPHNLGQTPFGVSTWFQDVAGSLLVSRYGSWNKRRILLKHSGTSVSCVVFLISERG